MKKLISYIAISLDGYIAKPDGSIDWLHELPNPDQLDYGYQDFYDSVDTIIMGNVTYQQICGFDMDFPYSDKCNYVVTRDQSKDKDENVTFISRNITGFVQSIKNQQGKNIWLVGGGQLNTLMLELIDELLVFIMPIILGRGISLFPGSAITQHLKMVSHKAYPTGVVELKYAKD